MSCSVFSRGVFSGHVIDPYPEFVLLKQRYRISKIRLVFFHHWLTLDTRKPTIN